VAGHPEGNAGLSSEIDSGLQTIWSRYVGERPTETAIELEGETVRWTIPDGCEQFDSLAEVDPEAEATGPKPMTIAGYNRETTKVVSTATRRAVNARFSKRDKKSGALTEIFILEPMHVRY
jgi:hypothetical protein